MSDRPGDAILRRAVARREPLVREVVAFVHEHPELAHEERHCSHFLLRQLEALGCSVEPGLAGMETGFRATLRGATPGPTVAIAALYDAVPSVPPEGGLRAVHSCGHGSIAAGVIGAMAALTEQRQVLAGQVVVMGCPADEIHAPETIRRGGGKLLSARAGAWAGIDAALYAHPEPLDTAWRTSMWMRRGTVRIAGSRDPRAGAGQPVLDAVERSVAALRELPAGAAMLEHLEFDGDVEAGAGMVAEAVFLLWAPDETALSDLSGRLRLQLDGDWTISAPVPSIAPDERVRTAVGEAITAADRVFVGDPPALPFATDFGAVTRAVPSALVGVGRAEGWAFHTPQGEAEFASEAGVEAALGMAEVLALSAARLTDRT